MSQALDQVHLVAVEPDGKLIQVLSSVETVSITGVWWRAEFRFGRAGRGEPRPKP
jgi:hypothetical protein